MLCRTMKMIAIFLFISIVLLNLTAASPCRESTDSPGVNYDGNVSQTIAGTSCIRWSSVNNSCSQGITGNYCRNPSSCPRTLPWCYTSVSPWLNWGLCDIPLCGTNTNTDNNALTIVVSVLVIILVVIVVTLVLCCICCPVYLAACCYWMCSQCMKCLKVFCSRICARCACRTSVKPANGVVLKPLDSDDLDYESVVDNIRSTDGSNWIDRIAGILRVESITQSSLYKTSNDLIVSANGSKITNERILWHGTSADALINICTDGFNRSYCGKNATAYGEGVYFAKNFSYSAQDKYSPSDSDGLKYIFQCRVLTGYYTTGSEELKEPPFMDEEDRRYDSVVDNTDDPTIFVIFRDMQAYPEYVIILETQD